MKRRQFEYEFEMEHGASTVEYVAVYTVIPGEPARGPSYSSGGEPGCDASVEDVEVFLETKRNGKRIRERRPELDGVLDEDVLLEAAGETEEAMREDPDDARDRARDDEYDRRADR